MRKGLHEEVTRLLKFESSTWHPIDEIGGCEYGFPPKVFRHMIREHDGSGYLKQVSIFPLGYPVLLRGINTRSHMNDTLFGKIRTKTRIEIFLAIICFKNLNFSFELGIDHRMKGFEDCHCFRFFFHEECPGCSSVIINE